MLVLGRFKNPVIIYPSEYFCVCAQLVGINFFWKFEVYLESQNKLEMKFSMGFLQNSDNACDTLYVISYNREPEMW